jgi:hypothetical protein
MSKALEQEVADILITSLDGLVSVRTSEQSDTLPEDSLVSVHLEQQTLRMANLTNLFDNRLGIRLKMHYAGNTKAEMDSAGNAIYDALTAVSLANTLNAYEVKLADIRAQVSDNHWERDYNLEVLRVDNAT